MRHEEKCSNSQKAESDAFKAMDYMCQELTDLEVIETLPDDHGVRQQIFDHALEVRSASMIFLASKIAYDETTFQLECSISHSMS